MSTRANDMHHPTTGRFNSKVEDQGLAIGSLGIGIDQHGAVLGLLGAAKRRVSKAQMAHADGQYGASAQHLQMAAEHLKQAALTYPPARDLAAKAQERAGIASSLA